MQPCPACYNFSLSANPDSEQFIRLQPTSGLSEGENYWWFTEDKFGRIYADVATFEEGTLKIPVSQFPEGYFTQYSGGFKVWVTSGPYQEPLELTFGGDAWTCINLDFVAINKTLLTVV